MEALTDDIKNHYKNLMDEDLDYVKNVVQKNLIKDKTEAHKRLMRLLNCDPDNPLYHYYMGTLILSDKGYGAALPYFYASQKYSDGQLPESFNNAGICLRSMNRIDEAHEMFLKAAELRSCSTYFGNIASYYVAKNTPDKAIDYCKKALEIDKDDNSALNNLSNAYLEKGMYKEAWAIYDARFNVEDKKRKIYSHDLPQWDGTPGKTVVVCGEQGIGDEIMFASVLPDAMRDCNVVLDVHDRLVSLFRNSFDGIPIYGTKRIFTADWQKDHKLDAKIAIGSLCKFYRNDEKDFPGTPYMKPVAAHVDFAKRRLEQAGITDKHTKIGFSWKGGTQKTFTDKRYNDLENWLEIFKKHKDVKFISLQYHSDSKKKLDEFCKKHDLKNIYHFDEIMADFELTAGLVKHLDLIVSIPQSVVHLAGSMGVPTWQLCPYQHLWQMGEFGKDMPWYKCVKSIWMQKDNDWPGVMKVVGEKLCKQFQKNIAA